MTKKTTKRALIVSMLSMFLCFTMMLGTTYAWFTDSVTSSGNIIKTGTLDVAFEWAKGAEDPANATWKDASEGAIFNYDKWEPGYVEARHVKITNKGSLAFRYELNIVPNGQVSKLADVIDVYYSETGKQISDRNGDLGQHQGTLAQVIRNGIASGTMEKGGERVITIVLKMQETAANEYQNLDLAGSFSVQLVATQAPVEEDDLGKDYDEGASVKVSTVDELRAAINNAEDEAIIFVESGTYKVDNVIVVDNKNITIMGLGLVTFLKTGGSHLFNVANSSKVTFKDLALDGNGLKREGIYVRNNCDVTLENVTIKNTAGKDIMIDEASDAEHGLETKSFVNLVNSHVEDAAFCASPVTTVPTATQDTYVYFNYDANSTVGSIEKQGINLKPENIYINGDNTDGTGTTMYLNVTNDAELAAALNTIKTNSAYWNNTVIVNLAAGEYSGDHVFDQYPQWNGVIGAGTTANNYATGVAGAPYTNVIFVGETVTTSYALTSATAPEVVFTGNFTVNGFGNAGTGFGTAVSTTTFQNVAFDGANSADEDDAADAVVMYVKAAANNVKFDGCVFVNATHVTLGGSGANGVGKVDVIGCTFNDGGCLSGYVETLNVENTVVTAAKNGFINKSKSGNVTVTGCEVNAGKYFIRTSNSGVNLVVEDTTVTLYESDGSAYLVYLRGTNESAAFTDCTLPATYTTKGVDADSTLQIIDYEEIDNVKYYTDGITGEKVLYGISDDFTGDTLTVPEGVTAFGNKVLRGNTTIKKVVVPTTLANFAGTPNETGTGASGGFFYQSAVEEVVLPEGIEEIPAAAFNQAENLKKVNIPSSVKKIGINAFAGSGLETLTISSNVEEIGYGAFRDMASLTTVTIEGDVYIPGYAFRNCSSLKDVYLNGTNVSFGNNMIFTVTGTNNENPNGITVHVANDAIKQRLEATGQFKGVIVSNETANSDGLYEDENGNEYAYANDNTVLSDVIAKGADTVYLSAGNYIIPDSAQGKTITIVGNGDTKIATQDDGSYEGCDYSLDGATVVFENITITTDSTTYTGYARLNATYNNCTINGSYTLYGNSTFNNCTFNVSGDVYNIWTWGAPTATFNGCTFNTSGKAILLYGNTNTKLTVNNCVFNDDNAYADVNNKAAIEVGSDWSTDTKEIVATGCTVNGFDVTTKGLNTGSTLWGNKNSLNTSRLNVVIDGVEAY